MLSLGYVAILVAIYVFVIPHLYPENKTRTTFTIRLNALKDKKLFDAINYESPKCDFDWYKCVRLFVMLVFTIFIFYTLTLLLPKIIDCKYAPICNIICYSLLAIETIVFCILIYSFFKYFPKWLSDERSKEFPSVPHN